MRILKKFLIPLTVAIIINSWGGLALSQERQSSTREIECLTENVYHESRGEPIKGQMAVAFVTLNRIESDIFPNKVCEVVQQRDNSRCQFSWYCDKRKKHITKKNSVKSSEEYIKSRMIAEYIYHNYDNIQDPTNGALYFHKKYGKIGKNGRSKRKGNGKVIGGHIFYNPSKLIVRR